MQGRAAVGAAIVDADVVFGALRLEMSGKDVVGKPKNAAATITNPFVNIGGGYTGDASVSTAMLQRQRSHLTKATSVASQSVFGGGGTSMAPVGRASVVSVGFSSFPVPAPPPPNTKVRVMRVDHWS